MKIIIKGDGLPKNVVEAVGSLANYAYLKIGAVTYSPDKQTVCFPLLRALIIDRSFSRDTRHAKAVVPCKVTIRNVSKCIIENHTTTLGTIQILFGIGYKNGTIFLSSVEEDRGTTCFTLSCHVSAVDIEISDD